MGGNCGSGGAEAPRYSQDRAIGWRLWPWKRTVCSAPMLRNFLKRKARAGWDQDAAAFSDWLAHFDEICRAGNLVSAARLPLELIEPLERGATPSARRCCLPASTAFCPRSTNFSTAWGTWSEARLGETATQIEFHSAADPAAELAACALWCKRQLAANPRHAPACGHAGCCPAPRRDRARVSALFERRSCAGRALQSL